LSDIPAAQIAPLSGDLLGRPAPTPGDPTRLESDPFLYTFTDAGSYTYRGELSQMRGTIIVVTPTPVR
jgi:hypothetical protein